MLDSPIDYYSEWDKFIRLNKLGLSQNEPIIVDVSLLPNTLFDQLTYKPSRALSILAEVLVKERNNHSKIRFSNYPRKVPIKDCRASRIGQFVSVEGIVRNIESIVPVVTNAEFQCVKCGNRVSLSQDKRSITYPNPCLCKGKWRLIPEFSETTDIQRMRLQETPEGLLGGETAAIVDVEVREDQCGRVTAGNRVVLNGILKAYQTKEQSLLLKTYIDGNFLELREKEFLSMDISDEEIDQIKSLSMSSDLVPQLVSAVSPSIYGVNNVKEALVLQLFGGVSKAEADGSRRRGDIHVLLVGDPGIAKSALLKSIINLCPRGLIVSGKGSSTAGLTASVVKDTSGQFTLEAGAVVLADQGQLIIDEIDKMGEEDRSALHQAMEQQEVSIAKAGICTTLQSRCSILAAANPKLGRFDDVVALAEQIDMPPTLLSRFDLIFLLLDHPCKETDRKIVDHIMMDRSVVLDRNLLRKYIAYSKQNIFPVFTDDAEIAIKEYYVRVRNLSSKGGVKAMPLTPRQFEASRRLCEAAARMRLSPTVELSDAEMALRVLDSSLVSVAYDKETGTFDIDKMCNKMSMSSRKGAEMVTEIVRKHIADNGVKSVSLNEVCQSLPQMQSNLIERYLETACSAGILFSPIVLRYATL